MSKQLHELSDDELSQLTHAQITEMAQAEEAANQGAEQEQNQDAEKQEGEEQVQTQSQQEVDANKSDDEGDNNEQQNQSEDEQAAAQAIADAKAEKPADTKTDKAEPAKTEEVKTETVVNYEEQFKEILKPFKANGREIQVSDVNEARQLMQMGANYNKKMQAMKPHLSTLRMLENAKIGEAELSYLIDLHRKDAGAINKLVKDSGIDPMDLTAEKATDYKPGNHKPSNEEVELEAVLNELDGSEGLPKTINIVTTQWDAKSKDTIASNPQVLRLINTHVESGIYDLVATEVERQRTFGLLAGLSDFDAYRQVGDKMNEKGAFAHIGGSSADGQQKAIAPVIKAPNPKKADDDKRKEQKRSAAPAKAAAPAAKTLNIDILNMPDDEFANFKLPT